MSRAVVYCHAGSASENDWQRSLASQEAECRAACSYHGWQIVDVFADHGRDRSGFERMAAALDDFDILVVHDLARISRTPGDLVELRAQCVAHDVDWCVGGAYVNPSQYVPFTMGGGLA